MSDKRVEMSHSSWLVCGGYESLEPKHFIKCLADDQMLWLELLRFDILENGKKTVLSYYLPTEHVGQLPRGIVSFLHILLPRLGTPTLMPPLWLANSYSSSFKIHLRTEVFPETQLLVSITEPHSCWFLLLLDHLSWDIVTYQSLYLSSLPFFWGRDPVLIVLIHMTHSRAQFTFVTLLNGCACLYRHYEMLIVITVIVNTYWVLLILRVLWFQVYV